MSTPIRWAVLGASNFAKNVTARAIHAADGASLTAIGTSSLDRAVAFQSFAPGIRVLDYDTLLADPEIDAVYIPLPNHLHVEWTEKALRAGKHVLCEKPLAMASNEIKRLIALRNETGLQAAEAFMVVHHPQWHRVQQLLRDGAIGTLHHIDGAFTYRNIDMDNIRNRPETGGGALRDIGVYPAVTARYATQAEPTSFRTRLTLEGGVDTTAHVWAEFPDFTMSFYVSMRMANRQQMVFHGTEGWLKLAAPFNARLYQDCRLDWQRGDGSVETEYFNGVDQYKLMFEAFGRSIRGQENFACPLEFSLGNQRMIDGIFVAAVE